MSIPQKRFLSELLECGVPDIDFFIKLLNKLEDNDIYLDVQEVLQTHGKIHINTFISESLIYPFYFVIIYDEYYKYKNKKCNVLIFSGFSTKNFIINTLF